MDRGNASPVVSRAHIAGHGIRCQALGMLAGECQMRGRSLKVADGLIAATALDHDLTVVTRNVRDFADLGVSVFNPWSTGSRPIIGR